MSAFPQPDPRRAALYRALGHWGDATIPGLILAQCARQPDKLAVRDAAGLDLTYGTLDQQSAALAGHLAQQGVGAGDIVTLCLPNWSQAVVAMLATLRLGAIINPVPVTYGRADLDFILRRCNSRALIIAGRFRSADFSDIAASLLPTLPQPPHVIRLGDGAVEIGTPFATALQADPVRELMPRRGDDPVAVLFTSGTESKPKGAVHSHNTILYGEKILAQALALTDADVAFMASPISHTTGFMHGVVLTLTSGATLSLLDVFTGPAAVAQMRAHHVTWTMGATPFLADSADVLAETGGTLPALRYFLSGGAAIPEALVLRAQAVGLRVLAIYGSTESPPHTLVRPDDPAENTWTSDGRALPGIEQKLVDPDGQEVATGEPGELWSRGPNTFLGYLGEPDLTTRDLDADGWNHSGDLARRLPDGSVRIVGRLKDIILRGGQNISVREVEDYLASHPAVASVVVVGLPHERLGETACAVIVPRPGCTPTLEDLTSHLIAKGVAKFKLPERLELRTALPMTPSGKIQKYLIRQSLNSEPNGQ